MKSGCSAGSRDVGPSTIPIHFFLKKMMCGATVLVRAVGDGWSVFQS
jgi:hypothetical protein